MKKIRTLKLFFITFILAAMVLGNGQIAKAEETGLSVSVDTEHSYSPTQIVNGDFNQYPTMGYVVNGTTITRDMVPWSANSRFRGGTYITSAIYNGVGEGWNTTEVQMSEYGMMYDYCRINSRSGTYPYYDTYSINATYNDNLFRNTCESKMANGNPFSMIEMNYYSPAVFWQDLYTQGGDVILWTLDHAARGSGNEIIHVEIGAPLSSGGQIVPASGIGYGNLKSNIEATSLASYRYTGVTNGSKNLGSANISELGGLKAYNASAAQTVWHDARGIYVIPSGQNITRFAFISDEPDGADGNLLDSITFSTLIGNLKGTVEEVDGNIVVNVSGYWGETNKAKKLICKIGDTEYQLDMTAIVEGSNKNFKFEIPSELLGDARQVSIYHQDYESAKRVVKLSHKHSWTYKGSSKFIKAYCEETDQAEYCEYNGSSNYVMIQILEDGVPFNEEGFPGLTISGVDEFNEATDHNINSNDIQYYKILDDGSEEPVATITERGAYKAKLTVEGITIEKKFGYGDDTVKEEPKLPTGIPAPEDTGRGTVEGINRFLGYIDYRPRFKNKMYAQNDIGEVVESTYIDFDSETLVTDLEYDCYSINNGKTWNKAGKGLTSKQITQFINKKATLCIAQGYNAKKHKPKADAVIYKFNKIEKRPVLPSYSVNFSKFADEYGITQGQWGITDKQGNLVNMTLIEIGEMDSKGKNIGEKGYGIWPETGGVWVSELGKSGKVTKTKYYYRIMSYETHPASKPKKLFVSSELKAPKIKVNYNTETIKLSAGMNVYFGNELPDISQFDPEEDTIEEINAVLNYDVVSTSALTVSGAAMDGKGILNISASDAKKKLSLTNYITTERNTIYIWKSATAKKPASAKQKIKLAKRYVLDKEISLVVKKGKASKGSALKNYVFYNESTGKWASGVPKVTQNTTIRARRKADAKGGKESDKTYAISEEAVLEITYGVIDKKTNKSGIISAVVKPASSAATADAEEEPAEELAEEPAEK